ncbi:MAG TPA: GNAT family N-acetyltransferase [Polyangia bacterium]|jgi:ribosomal protein S18 acetylase RimI-like enzyme|nr:GNAT family N-acetyltransferase [Polyangia bacterium]
MVRGEQSAPASHAIVRASPAVARKQADWIVGIEPWKSLGYRTAGLGQYLARLARTGDVWIARTAARAPAGIIVATDGFLLGGFIALLAVRPGSSGQGLGQALVAHVEGRVFARRRWLFVSCDAENGAAMRFYRRQGFARVGRLPDLVREGRVEILLRKARNASS